MALYGLKSPSHMLTGACHGRTVGRVIRPQEGLPSPTWGRNGSKDLGRGASKVRSQKRSRNPLTKRGRKRTQASETSRWKVLEIREMERQGWVRGYLGFVNDL